jgi:DNA-binding transcriptional ArsR family regulator
MTDIPMVIKTALSTALIRRVKVLDLLLKNNGEITTSQIVKQLKISPPTARLTIREYEALGIVDVSYVSAYQNAELKATLNSQFNWFKGEEFKKLREDFVPATDTSNRNDASSNSNDNSDQTTDESSSNGEMFIIHQILVSPVMVENI